MDEHNLNWHEDTKDINKAHKKKLPAANLSIKNKAAITAPENPFNVLHKHRNLLHSLIPEHRSHTGTRFSCCC